MSKITIRFEDGHVINYEGKENDVELWRMVSNYQNKQGIMYGVQSDAELSKLLIQPNGKTKWQEIWERIIKEQSDKIRGTL